MTCRSPWRERSNLSSSSLKSTGLTPTTRSVLCFLSTSALADVSLQLRQQPPPDLLTSSSIGVLMQRMPLRLCSGAKRELFVLAVDISNKGTFFMAGRVCGGQPAGLMGAAGTGAARDLPLCNAPDRLAGLLGEHPPPWHPQVTRPCMQHIAAMTGCRLTAREHDHDCVHDQMGGGVPCRSRCALQMIIGKEHQDPASWQGRALSSI